MKPDELTNYFARCGDDLPTEVAQAVTELPAEYSGVPQSRHDLLTERALNTQFGPAIEEIKEIEQAIEAAESTVEAARDEVRLEVGIHDPAKFNALAAPIEAKHGAPWLKRTRSAGGTEEIRVVVRPATPEEIESGIEYRDHDHLHGRESSMTKADKDTRDPVDSGRSEEGSGGGDAPPPARDVGQGRPRDQRADQAFKELAPLCPLSGVTLGWKVIFGPALHG